MSNTNYPVAPLPVLAISGLFFMLCGIFAPGLQAQPNAQSPLGLNITSTVAWENEWMYVNIAHHSLAWFPNNTPVAWDQWYAKSDLQGNGYLKPGQTGTLAIVWGPDVAITDTFVLTWEGDATLGLDDQPQIFQATILNSQPGRIEFYVENQIFMFVEVSQNSVQNPLHNLRCVRKAHENLNQTFTPELLDLLRPFKVLRFMDQMETNNSKVVRYQDYTPENGLLQAPAGLDKLVELSNLVHADPWFCVPLLANDSFVLYMAHYIAQNLESGRTVRVELSNEVWNGIFDQHEQAANLARQLNLSNTGHNWEDAPAYYGFRSAQIHKIFRNVFAQYPNAPQLCTLVAWQNASTYFFENFILPNYQLASGNNAVPDAIAAAPYFGYSLGDPDKMAIVENWTLDQLFDQLQNGTYFPNEGTVLEPFSAYGDYQSLMQKWNIQHLIAYEAGQHLVGFGGAENNETLINLFNNANRDPRMKALYQKYFAAWRAAGGELMTMFSSHSAFGKYGSWGLKESLKQPLAQCPKLQAVLEYIENTPVSWNNCGFEYNTVSSNSAQNDKNQLLIYPNPAGNEIQLNFSGSLQIQTITGQTVLNLQQVIADHAISIAQLPNGIYICQGANTSGQFFVQKLLVQH